MVAGETADTLDVLSHVAEELTEARLSLSAQLDRTEALSRLLNRADAVAAQKNQLTLTIDELMNAHDEEARAEVAALLIRAFATNPDNPTH